MNEPRAEANLFVHEKTLDGKFDLVLNMDLDTMRTLGAFFIQLADQSEAVGIEQKRIK